MPEQKQPWKICRVAGREFRIHEEYDEEVGARYPVYPDFAECPEYTSDGRPFTTAEHEGCPHYKTLNPNSPETDDCGGCRCFCRDETPYDIIGVCMCEAMRIKPNAKDIC